MLNHQNKARSLLGETNFTWNSTLANLTESWAKKCGYADTGTYGGFKHGSNVAAWTGYTPTGKDCAQAFVNERSKYLGGVITATSSQCVGNNIDACGHYTQVGSCIL